MRILHLADVHLDRPFVGLSPETARARRADLMAAFERCLALALDRGADLVTIGGDLWEEEHVRADTRNSVAYALGQLALPVLVVCGNHDPLLPGGSHTRTTWPENVTIVPRGSQLTEHRFGSLSVWSVSWGGGDLSPQILRNIELRDNGRTHVLLIHGTSTAASFAVGDTSYLPFDPSLVSRAGFATCLAGHIHIASYIEDVVYPGSPEPLGWAEIGRHCAALVELEAGRATVDLIDVNRRRFEVRDVDCKACSSSAHIGDRVLEALHDVDPENVFLRMRLNGEVDPDCEIDRQRIWATHNSRYAALVVEDRTVPVLDIERRAERRGLDGLFVRKLMERLDAAPDGREKHVLELALQAGVRALEGRDGILRVD